MAKAVIATLKSVPFTMAVVTGAAAAFVCAILPDWRLEAMVTATGLASVLAAAEPPLGGTARALFTLSGGLAAAILTFLVLRALEGLPNIKLPRVRRSADGAIAVRAQPPRRDEAPRIELARRPPILAGADLGAPFNSVTADVRPNVDTRVFAPTPPAWIEPLELETPLPPLTEAEAEIEPVAAEAETAAPRVAEAAGDAAPIRVRPGESISSMVERIETGMERRRLALAVGRPEAVAAVPETPDIDAALRDALGTLQRMAARPR